ncbi:MAG: sulfatase-like hydrolase/transferase [Rhodothermales bacterium]
MRPRIILLVLLGLAGLRCGGTPPAETPPLNVVWISVEDMSPRLAAYGDTLAKTPNIDRLAREGERYAHAYSISGVCAPSRAALITGMYPTTIGAQHMRTLARTADIAKITDPELLAIPVYEAVPPPEVRCFPEYLRAAGYYTTNNVKEDYQFRRPITAWDESSRTAHWRNRRDPDQPFFAVFNFTTTHESQIWSRDDEPLRVDPAAVPLPPYYPDTPIVRRDIARHYSNIELMDAQVGQVLRELEEDGLMDRTVVFFFSDHGDGMPRMKRWVYDSGLRVPLIIRWPDGRHAGAVNDRMVSFVDFAPSMLSLLGLDVPAHLQGIPFLGDRAGPERAHVFAARDRMDPAIDNVRAVRDRRFKYIRNYMPERPYVQFLPYRDRMGIMQELHRLHAEGQLDAVQSLWFRETKPREELYDTEADPHEIVNLAGDPAYADKLAELRAEHERWKAETRDIGLLPETELVKRMWPPDGVQPATQPPVATPDAGGGVTLASATEGASIAYARGADAPWLLYTRPLHLAAGDTLRAVAIRIGFKQSEEAVYVE